MEKSRYTLVHHPDADPAELARILDQIDPEILASEDQGEILPRTRHIGPCRICGRIAELTREHIPPRSAFNKERIEFSEGDELFEDGLLTEPTTSRKIQGGLSGYVLCESCNNFTGTRYAREYQEWALRAAGCLRDIHNNQIPLDKINEMEEECPVDATFRGVYPGRFIRQVISMMLCISGGPELSERFPDLRDLVLGGEPRLLPAPLRVYFDLFAGPGGRTAGGKFGHFVWTGHTVRQVLEISYPPLTFIMLIGGSPDRNLGCDITFLTESDPDRETSVELSDLRVCFNNTIAPTDYRTLGQIMAKHDRNSA